MKIIISPAKKMNIDVDWLEPSDNPVFLEKTQQIVSELQKLNFEELKELWKCNDRLVLQNKKRIENMDLHNNLTPAILAYDGIQYKYMSPAVFENSMLRYISKHLCILSGFYGVLKPMDGVAPYRLEMQALIEIEEHKNLYSFWGDAIYKEVVKDDRIVLNLASKEYSRCIQRYLKDEDKFITCIFGDLYDGRVIQRATFAKMARGEMVRFMAENNIEDLEEIKKFNRLGFNYSEKYSRDNKFVFIRNYD